MKQNSDINSNIEESLGSEMITDLSTNEKGQLIRVQHGR